MPMFTRFSLLASGFLTALTVYFFYATSKYISFAPPPVPTKLLPQWVPWYKPELDLHLYISGLLLTVLGGIIWYGIISKHLRANSIQLYQIPIQIYLRVTAVLVLILFILITHFWLWWVENYLLIGTLILPIIAGLMWKIILPTKSNQIFTTRFLIFYDSVFVLVISLLASRILLGIVLYDDFRRGSLFYYLSSNDYFAFRGFGVHEYLSVFGFVIVVMWLWLKPFKFHPKLRSIVIAVLDLCVVAAILWLTSTIVMIRPDDDVDLARHNMGTFLGPVSDVLAGKTLLVDVPSQYGFLMIYGLSAILQFLPRMYTSLVWVIYGFMVFGFISLYISLRRWMGFGAIIVIVLVYEHYYFSGSTNILWNTAQSFVRFGWWILIFMLLVIKSTAHRYTKFMHWLELFLVSLGLFWGFETGLYSAIAYMGYRVYTVLLNQRQLLRRLADISVIVIEILLSCIIVAVLLSVFTFLRSRSWPDWSQFGAFASIYTAGFYVFPMQIIGPYIIVLTIYGLTVLLLLSKIFSANQIQKQERVEYGFASYVVCLGLSQFIYFTGHSNTNGNLHVISIPAMILFVWLLLKLPKAYLSLRALPKPIWSPYLFWSGSVLVGICFTILTTVGTVTTARVVKNRLDFMTPWLDRSYKEIVLADSVSAVDSYLKNAKGGDRRVAIVSTDVQYYLFKTYSANMLSYNYNFTLLTVDQVEKLSNELVDINPDIVFVDEAYHPNNEAIFSRVRNNYTRLEGYGSLDKWVRNDVL